MNTDDFRWYQQDAINSFFDYIEENPEEGNPLICLPTGTGKGRVLNGLMQAMIEVFPQSRHMALTHVKELIGQNYNAMDAIWPSAPTGVYSAGLKKKDAVQPIIYGGIQSVVNLSLIHI